MAKTYVPGSYNLYSTFFWISSLSAYFECPVFPSRFSAVVWSAVLTSSTKPAALPHFGFCLHFDSQLLISLTDQNNSTLIYFRTISSYPIIIDLLLRTRLLILKKSLWKIFCILSEKCCLICLLQYYHMWSKHYLRILYLTQWEVCLWLGLGWPLCWRWPVSMTHAWWSGGCHPPRVGGWGRHSVVAWTDCPGNHHTLTAGTYNMR